MFKKINDDIENSDVDVSSVYSFRHPHSLPKRGDSSTFNNIYGYVDKGDVSSGYGSMNIHTY